MGRASLALCCALGLAAAARASGDTGTLLATPYKLVTGGQAPNEAASSIRLGGASDPYTDDRPQWHALDDAHYCYARRDGVGLRVDGQSVLVGEIGVPERIAYVAVTCGVASKSALGESLALTLTAGGTVSSKPFAIDEQGQTRTVIFSFDPTLEADELRFSNAGAAIFEIHRVVWRPTLPSIVPEVTFYREVAAGETLFCTVDDCTGGTGDYAVTWTFNGEGRAPTGDYRTPVRFTAPSAPGCYPLTLVVRDTGGNSFTQTYEVCVRSFNPARDLSVSGVTRTGFDLTWERPAGTVTAEDFVVTVRGAETEDFSATLRPEWTRQGSAWVSAPLSLGEAYGSLSNLLLGASGIGSGNYLEACPEEGSWAPLSGAVGFYFGLALAPGEAFRLRTDAAVPPDAVTLRGACADVLWEAVVPAVGQRLEAAVGGLPAGREVLASVRPRFRRDDRSLISGDALTQAVALLPVPVPAAAQEEGVLRFDWAAYGDALAEEPVIRLDFYAETPAEGGPEPGLYLTRAFLTGDAGKEGLDLDAAKAVVLTNTTGRDIPLDGKGHVLRVTSASGGKHSFWDFYIPGDDGEKTYPLVVPAHGELVLAHARSTPDDLPEGAVTSTTGVLNFGDGGAIALLLGDRETLIDELPTAFSTVARLRASDLGHDVTALTRASASDPAFSEPWDQPLPQAWRLLTERCTAANAYLEYGGLFTLPEGATRLWVELRTEIGQEVSEPLTLVLWERVDAEADPPERPGFRLILR